MTGFYSIGEAATGYAAQEGAAGRNGSLSAILAGMSVAAAGQAQKHPARAGSLASQLSGMSLAAAGTAQRNGRNGALAAALAGMSLAAGGHAQIAGRGGAFQAVMAGMFLAADGQAQRGPRGGTLAATMAGVQVYASGQAQRAPVHGVLDVALGGLSMSAAGGAFPFRRSEARTHIVHAEVQNRPVPPYGISPGSRLDFSFDWSPFLDDSGDIIASYSVIAPAAIGKACIMLDNGVVTTWLDAFHAGYSHWIDCNITTAAGRKDSRRITLKVAPQ